MPNQCITDIICATDKRTDTTFEMAIDSEILLADYDRPVFKIIKTIIDHSITQKYVNGNRLIIEGFFRTSVFYQPPGGESLTVVSKKQTFQKQLELLTPVTQSYFINISGDLQYVNTRAVNPTRIAINGVYQFAVELYTTENIPITTAINSENVCTDTGAVTYFTLRGRAGRQFSMEDELAVGEKTDKILHINACPINVSATAYQDKVNVKGEVEAEIVFSLTDSATVQIVKKKFPFNQIVDVAGATENSVAYSDLSVISTTVTANGDGGRVNCIVTAAMDVKVFRKNTVISVKDAFSKKYITEKKTATVAYDKNIYSVNKTINCSIEDNVAGGYTPIYSFINMGTPFVDSKDGKNLLKSKVYLTALVMNSQKEYESFGKTGEIVIDTGKEATPEDKYFLKCNIQNKTITTSGNNLKVDFTIDVSGFAIATQKETVMESFVEDSEKAVIKNDNSLVLYYGKKGERIFDIGMRYSTDVEAIMTENNLSGQYLDSDRMILVPSFGM